MRTNFPINKFHNIKTPFYYYDSGLLRDTLNIIYKETTKYKNYCIHYAIKANSNPKILKIISQYGFGADCVSGGGYKQRLMRDFLPQKLCMPVSVKAIGK